MQQQMKQKIQIKLKENIIFESIKVIDYKSKKYCVISIKHFTDDQLNYVVPFIIDYEDYDMIKSNYWIYINSGYIGYSYMHDGAKKIVYMHNLLMNNDLFQGKGAKITIDHINRIGLDNRKENLKLSTPSEQNYNQNKKERNLILPEGCGIDPNDIPTNIEYNKEDGAHGAYFEVVLKKNGVKIVREKTTKKKGESLKSKLEQAKDIMNSYMQSNPELFQDRCINGDLSELGMNLYKSYFEILELAQVNDPFHCEDEKIYMPGRLLNVDYNNIATKRKINMPNKITNITTLPANCRYGKATENRGDYFEYEKRTDGKRIVHSSSKSKNMSTNEKYDQLINILQRENLM